MTRCDECGASYADASDSCTKRFGQLLALDHSRQEPWGSRHGLAFAAFALQHPGRFDSATTDRSRELVERVLVQGEALDRVVREFRAAPSRPDRGVSKPRSTEYPVTIVDLGDFDAARYADNLERWCLSALGSREREL